MDHARHQHFGIVALRIIKDFVTAAFFDNIATQNERHSITEVSDNRKIVADEKIGQTEWFRRNFF